MAKSRRIGIFTKMEMAGGSEFRAVEMAASIAAIPGYEPVLLAERQISRKLRPAIPDDIEVQEGILSKPNIDPLYSVDHLLVINTDSRDFTTDRYWAGRSDRHPHRVDLGRVKQMVFLFNFIVSPAVHLPGIKKRVGDVRIITANSKFYNEVSEQSRYEPVRHYPRLQLESPISSEFAGPKNVNGHLRLGMHSLGVASKWNAELPELIRTVNASHGEKIEWRFMGMPKACRTEIRENNVRIYKEFSLPVSEYLRELDVFVFFLDWKREEAWARSVGEALMSGCPVITTARGGNKNQITHGNTGYLCKDLGQFAESCKKLIDDAHLRASMQSNARCSARQFSSEAVANKFLRFIEC